MRYRPPALAHTTACSAPENAIQPCGVQIAQPAQGLCSSVDWTAWIGGHRLSTPTKFQPLLELKAARSLRHSLALACSRRSKAPVSARMPLAEENPKHANLDVYRDIHQCQGHDYLSASLINETPVGTGRCKNLRAISRPAPAPGAA